MSEALYVRRSLQHLSDALAERGHTACPTTVADMLEDLGYSLRVNVKRLTGPCHPDRDKQFHHLNSFVELFREEGWPILSVDAKKKELVGNFANRGATWVPQSYEVNAHDFLSDAQYRAAPYGLYDVLANQGHVIVGTSADTPQFAAEAVARWWARIGCHRYRRAGALLILADSGGSNGHRPRLWKKSLQELLAIGMAWLSRCVTIPRAHRSGIRWSTDCSARSVSTGRACRCSRPRCCWGSCAVRPAKAACASRRNGGSDCTREA
jgi:Rhodopirellula transposase DDE domain